MKDKKDILKYKNNSILSQGYGIIPKRVMRDLQLNVEAKAIYAYMCAFAGAGQTAFPGVELMMAELNMGEKRFYKFRKQLIEKGYITIEKQRNGNRRDTNVYVLNTEIFEHCQFESVQNESVHNESFQNEGTNNNSLNNNSLNNNNINNDDINERELKEVIEYYCKKAVITEINLRSDEVQSIIKLLDMKISVEIIKEGIDKGFKNFKAKFKGDKIKSFKYIEPIILGLAADKDKENEVKSNSSAYEPFDFN